MHYQFRTALIPFRLIMPESLGLMMQLRAVVDPYQVTPASFDGALRDQALENDSVIEVIATVFLGLMRNSMFISHRIMDIDFVV
jgi:hypothetical protein